MHTCRSGADAAQQPRGSDAPRGADWDDLRLAGNRIHGGQLARGATARRRADAVQVGAHGGTLRHYGRVRYDGHAAAARLPMHAHVLRHARGRERAVLSARSLIARQVSSKQYNGCSGS